MELALRENLTFYDAALLPAAMEEKAALITDDARLARTAKKYVRVLKSGELRK